MIEVTTASRADVASPSWVIEDDETPNAYAQSANDRNRRPPSATCSIAASSFSRISELLQIYGVDPITVAAQTGTSVAMIEKAYLRFIPSAMQEKLAALKA